MSWATLLDYETVSFTDLQTSPFSVVSTIPTSNELVTKADAPSYVAISTSYAPFSALASGEAIIKSNLISAYSWTAYLPDGDGCGWGTSADACTGTRANVVTIYSDTSTITAGTRLYVIYSGTYSEFWRPCATNAWIYVDGVGPVQMNTDTNQVVGVGTCVTTYTITYTVNNANAGSNNQAEIYTNSTLYTQTTGNPPSGISGNFTINSGDTIQAIILNSGASGFTQTLDITGGATYSSGTISDTGANSGVLTPTGNTTISIELS